MRIASLIAALLLSTSLLLAQKAAKPEAGANDTLVNGTAKNVVHVLGLEGVARNAKGELRVHDGILEFQTAAGRGQIKVSSIDDILTGQDSKQVGGTPLNVVKLAAPFGSGRALSLFAHQKIDNLTVEYRDENEGFHGTIFVLAKGQAALVKKELVAQGAHTTVAPSDDATTAKPEAKDKK